MRRIPLLLFFTGLVLLALQWSAFSEKEQLPTERIQADYRLHLTAFKNSVDSLLLSAKALQTKKQTLSSYQTAVVRSRNAFKKIEFLLEYLEPELVKDYINGAPLIHQERSSAQPNLLDPEGLQAIDELAFSDEAENATEELLVLSEKLHNRISSGLNYQYNVLLQDRHVFEASRQELLRVFTLGTSGFDTPGSSNGVKESLVVMQTLQQTFSHYEGYLADHQKDIETALTETLANATTYLQANQDFDTFDRLFFLTTYVNPLYKLIYQLHTGLGVETIDETTDLIQPTNYHATNLFAANFLNASYYSEIYEAQLTPQKTELGKVLFFDPILSGNNERACASCHNPSKAFTDGQAKSVGFEPSTKVNRNSPTIINSIYAERYFHDLRADAINNQVEHVLVNPDEFNTTYLEVIEKLNQSAAYQKLFQQAFPELKNQPISKHSINQALTAFVQQMSSFNSPFDQYIRGESAELPEEIKQGFNLFMGKAACGTCHFAPTFNGTVPPFYEETDSEVLGVPATKDTLNPPLDPDLGRRGSDRMKERSKIHENAFKTVTVRNVELTAPYMHNGVYDTLEEVIDFYNRGGGAGMGISIENQTLSDQPLDLSASEQRALIAFMRALTDTSLNHIQVPELPAFDQESALNQRIPGGKY